MRPNHARLLLLLLVATIAWLSAADKLLPRPEGLYYQQRGIFFVVDPKGMVINMTIRAADALLGERPPREVPGYEVGEDEIRPGQGALGIELGLSAGELIERLGPPRYDMRNGEWRTLIYRDGNHFSLFFEEDILTHIQVERCRAETPEGIAIGSTEAEVRDAYGTPDPSAGLIFLASPPKRAAQAILRSLILGVAFFCISLTRRFRLSMAGPAGWALAGYLSWVLADVVRDLMTYGHPFSTLQFLLTAWRWPGGGLTYILMFAYSMLGCVIGVGIYLGGAGERPGCWKHVAPASLSLLLPLALIVIARLIIRAVHGVGPVSVLAVGSVAATGPLAYLNTYLIRHSIKKKHLPTLEGDLSYDKAAHNNRSDVSGEDRDRL